MAVDTEFHKAPDVPLRVRRRRTHPIHLYAIPALLPEDQEDLLDDDGLERVPSGDWRPSIFRRVPDARLKHLWGRCVDDAAAVGHDIFALRDDPSTMWLGTHLLVVREAGARPSPEATATRAVLASFDGRRVDPALLRALSTDRPRQVALSEALIDASGAWSTPRLLSSRLEALAAALGWSLEADHARRHEGAVYVGPTHGVVWLAILWQGAQRLGSTPDHPVPVGSRWTESVAPVMASARAQSPDFRCLPIEVHARGVFDPTYALLCRTRLEPARARTCPSGGSPISPTVFDLLWAEVLAHPTDLAARNVLADAYTAVGDARGTFMQASLRAVATAEPAAGQRAALRAHERTWLGAMADEAHSPRVWKGGVLAGFHARCIDERKPPRPEWRLLEELRTWISTPRDVNFLAPERFPALRVLGLVESTPTYRGTHTAVDVLNALTGLGMMSQLETIFLHIGEPLQWARTLRPLAAWAQATRVVLVADWAGHPLPDELHRIVRRFRTASLPSRSPLLKQQLWPAGSAQPPSRTATERGTPVAYDCTVELSVWGPDDQAWLLAQVFADPGFSRVRVRARREIVDGRTPEWPRVQLDLTVRAVDPKHIAVAAEFARLQIVGDIQPSAAASV